MASYCVFCALITSSILAVCSAVDNSTAYVSAGSIVSFTSIVSKQQREDVLNSTLLAQLAATVEYERYTQVESWYKLYFETLRSVGWTVADYDFTTFSVANGTNWTAPALKMMDEKITDKDQQNVLYRSVRAFLGLNFNDTRMLIFRGFSMENSEANFQLIPVTVNAQKMISIVLGCFATTTLEKRTDGFVSVTVATLSDTVYGNYRAGVLADLKDASITDVIQLKLS